MLLKDLLYESDKSLVTDTNIGGKIYYNSITPSTPVSIDIKLDGGFNSFICSVGMDTVTSNSALADFFVYADGKLIDAVKNVSKSNTHEIRVNLYGASMLRLEIKSKRRGIQASWIEPKVHTDSISQLGCPINSIICDYPQSPIKSKKCVAAVLTNGMEVLFKEMIQSIARNNDMGDVKIVVFGFDLDDSSRRIVAENNGIIVDCKSTGEIRGTGYKTVLPLLPYIVLADKYMYIDCDCLICNEIFHLFDMLDNLEYGSILAARHGDKDNVHTFKDALLSRDNFESDQKDIGFLGDTSFTGVINTGFFVGSDCSLFYINHAIREFMPQIKIWAEADGTNNVREEAVFIAGLCGVNLVTILNESYNFQVHLHSDGFLANIIVSSGIVYYKDIRVQIIHFTGLTKQLYYNKVLRMIKQ